MGLERNLARAAASEQPVARTSQQKCGDNSPLVKTAGDPAVSVYVEPHIEMRAG